MTHRHAWIIAGTGARRWGLLGSATAVGAEQAACFGARVFRLPRDRPARVLAALDADLGAGWIAAGWIGYEVGAAIEGVAPAGPPRGLPDAAWWLCRPSAVAALPDRPVVDAVSLPVTLPLALVRQRRGFERGVARLVDAIGAGVVYQTNLTVAARMPWQEPPELADLVAALGAAQPVPLAMAVGGPFGVGGRQVVAATGTMESFLRVRGRRVATRPIKGTIARGRSAEADAQQRAALCSRVKERAENTMIVDMARNDLQRACRPGSVRVTSLAEPVAYRTLWHLESEVHGTRTDKVLAPLLAATLPPASVTGCPKIEAMRAIASLERRRRGPYCGTFFVAHPDGWADFAVGIRTATFAAGHATVSAGAGIVADSDPAAEWRETCLKARSALAALAALSRQRP